MPFWYLWVFTVCNLWLDLFNCDTCHCSKYANYYWTYLIVILVIVHNMQIIIGHVFEYNTFEWSQICNLLLDMFDYDTCDCSRYANYYQTCSIAIYMIVHKYVIYYWTCSFAIRVIVHDMQIIIVHVWLQYLWLFTICKLSDMFDCNTCNWSWYANYYRTSSNVILANYYHTCSVNVHTMQIGQNICEYLANIELFCITVNTTIHLN